MAKPSAEKVAASSTNESYESKRIEDRHDVIITSDKPEKHVVIITPHTGKNQFLIHLSSVDCPGICPT